MKLTNNQWNVINYLQTEWLLKDVVFISPSVIGRELRGPNHHSAWASPICKKLVEKGLLERNNHGCYALTKKGRGYKEGV